MTHNDPTGQYTPPTSSDEAAIQNQQNAYNNVATLGNANAPVVRPTNPTRDQALNRPGVRLVIAEFKREYNKDPDDDQVNFYINYDIANQNGVANHFLRGHFLEEFPTQFYNSFDPNDIFGPQGSGAAGFVQGSSAFPYEITFQNKPTASAPAKIVTIVEQLDANLDWSTFQLGTISFGSHSIAVPAGLTSYETSVTLSDTLRVDITADFNTVTGMLTETFTSIDPTTGDVPVDALAGFLPPNTVIVISRACSEPALAWKK